jgi:hypothetical protein
MVLTRNHTPVIYHRKLDLHVLLCFFFGRTVRYASVSCRSRDMFDVFEWPDDDLNTARNCELGHRKCMRKAMNRFCMLLDGGNKG